MNNVFSRREFLGAGAAIPFTGAFLDALIHRTDLFHPHNVPDDHFDLDRVFCVR